MILLQFAILLLLCGGVHFLEPTYDVLSPKIRTIGVPEKFTVESFAHEGDFPVQGSLRSNLDNAVTHDSKQLHLSSTNRHQRFSSLKKKLEDSPSRDEVERFVYVVGKSKDIIKEENMVEADKSRLMERKPDVKAPKRFKRDLKMEIEEEAERYSTEKIKQCCLDGYDHYTKDKECHRRLKEKQKEQRPRCYKAFEQCCIYSKDYFEKQSNIYHNPREYSYCVQMPQFWKVAEPQKVTFFEHALYLSRNRYLVRMLLLSYPDKNVTYDSKEFLLNPNDSGQDKSLRLLVKLDDLPNGDELEKFMYLVIDVEGTITERKVPLLDLRVTRLDLKKSNGSPEDLKTKIEAVASKYPLRRVKRTCREGYKHYVIKSECQNRLTETEWMPGLHRVFQKCCLYAREYTHKLANTVPERYNIDEMCGFRSGKLEIDYL